MGQRAPAVERRWLLRALRDRLHEARKQAHFNRSADQLARNARDVPSCPSSWHRHSTRHGDAQHHHPGRLVRPRLRRSFLLRLRTAGGACRHDAAEKAAEICGLDVEDIYGATRMYANAAMRQSFGALQSTRKPTARRRDIASYPSRPSPATWTSPAASFLGTLTTPSATSVSAGKS